jgi:hypothetical protein
MDSETVKAVAGIALLAIVALIAIMVIYLLVSNKKDSRVRASLPPTAGEPLTNAGKNSSPATGTPSRDTEALKPARDFSFADAASPPKPEPVSEVVRSTQTPALASKGPVLSSDDKAPKLALKRRRSNDGGGTSYSAPMVLPTKAKPVFTKSDQDTSGW